MKTRAILFAAVAALCCTSLAGAADLTKIARKIAKEPTYQTKSPRYCLLVFGPEANTRIWLVQDGDVLYVDRNGNGDLTEEGERVTSKQKGVAWFEAGDLRDGSLTHTGLSVIRSSATPDLIGSVKDFERIKGLGSDPYVWTVRVKAERPADDDRPLPRHIGYVVNGDGTGWLSFGNRPENAPVIHFNGPWTLELQDVKQRLVPGQKSNLQIGVGTSGLEPGTFTWVLYPDTIPNDVYPVAKITFPPKTPAQKPVTEEFKLMSRC
jgi:hypothetical protein